MGHPYPKLPSLIGNKYHIFSAKGMRCFGTVLATSGAIQEPPCTDLFSSCSAHADADADEDEDPDVEAGPDDARIVNADFPAEITCGSAVEAVVVMENTGTTDWTQASEKTKALTIDSCKGQGRVLKRRRPRSLLRPPWAPLTRRATRALRR
jgi:hypothetical protein